MTFHTIRQFGAVAKKKSVSVGTAPSSGDCVAYWKLEDVNDSVGSNNLTNVGATSGITGKVGNAYRFDGVNDSMTVPAAFDTMLTGNFSISLWFKPNVWDQDGAGTTTWLITFRDERNVQLRMVDGGTIEINMFTGTDYSATTTTTYSTGSWIHVVATKSSTNGLRIYVNDTLEATNGSATGTPATATATSAIGAYPASAGNFNLDGEMDEVGLFDVELTGDNVTYLYQSGNPGTAQQYPFT